MRSNRRTASREYSNQDLFEKRRPNGRVTPECLLRLIQQFALQSENLDKKIKPEKQKVHTENPILLMNSLDSLRKILKSDLNAAPHHSPLGVQP